MIRIFINLVISIVFALVLTPVVYWLVKKKKASQPILGYVDNHTSKAGTPTMGGIIFVMTALSVTASTLPKFGALTFMLCMGILSFCIIGFMDDYIKVTSRKNMGLQPYQKIIGQVSFAVLLSIFAYNNRLVGGLIRIPFSDIFVDLGVWSIPLYSVVLIAIVNAVNLTDGLDGLAASTSTISIITFGVMIVLSIISSNNNAIKSEYVSLLVFDTSLVGALIVFLVMNCFPANIFMGDTGSLALGGAIGCIAIFTRNVLYIPIVCFVHLLSAISVILQVGCYKLTGRRIFKMAPFHHHLERKGLHENKIVAIYCLITVILCVLSIILY